MRVDAGFRLGVQNQTTRLFVPASIEALRNDLECPRLIGFGFYTHHQLTTITTNETTLANIIEHRNQFKHLPQSNILTI
jgi:hypothetical protein